MKPFFQCRAPAAIQRAAGSRGPPSDTHTPSLLRTPKQGCFLQCTTPRRAGAHMLCTRPPLCAPRPPATTAARVTAFCPLGCNATRMVWWQVRTEPTVCPMGCNAMSISVEAGGSLLPVTPPPNGPQWGNLALPRLQQCRRGASHRCPDVAHTGHACLTAGSKWLPTQPVSGQHGNRVGPPPSHGSHATSNNNGGNEGDGVGFFRAMNARRSWGRQTAGKAQHMQITVKRQLYRFTQKHL